MESGYETETVDNASNDESFSGLSDTESGNERGPKDPSDTSSGTISSDVVQTIPVTEPIDATGTNEKDPGKKTSTGALPDDIWSRSVGDDYDDEGLKIIPDPPEPEREKKIRDPNYVDSLDFDDPDVDIDLDRADFTDAEILQEPEEIVIETCPPSEAQYVQDIRAIPINIVTREEWGALPRPQDEVPLKPNARFIHLEFNSGTESCLTKEECILRVQEIQKMHLERGLSDIQYNFLLGGDGNAYEGRGWHVEPPKSNAISKYKGKYLEFAYIGDYTDEVPSDNQMIAQFSLIKKGIDENDFDEVFNFIQKDKNLTVEPEFTKRKKKKVIPPRILLQKQQQKQKEVNEQLINSMP